MKVENVPIVTGQLPDLLFTKYIEHPNADRKNDCESLAVTLMGESKIKPRFRIPAFNSRAHLFFDNQELFCRFAALTLPVQDIFVRAVQAVSRAHKINIICLDIMWSRSTNRTLQIKVDEPNGDLNFELH